VKAPPLNEIEDKVYKHQGKCYKFIPVTTKCDAKKKNVEM
jgi:predicted Fe-Mo cluster-binding NifX family protein